MNKVNDMVSLIMLLEKGQQAFLDALRNKNLTPQMAGHGKFLDTRVLVYSSISAGCHQI